MTIKLTKYFGINVRRMPDANGKMYAAFVVWYPRNWHRLGYLYFSVPVL